MPGFRRVTSLVLLVSAAFLSTIPIQVIHATASPYLRDSSWNYAGPSGAVACTLSDIVAGDTLFVTLESSTVQQSSMTVSDSAHSAYSYVSNWEVSHGMGAAYAQAPSSGTFVISASVSNGGAGLSLFCYDIAGASVIVSYSAGSGSYGGQISVTPFNITPNSFVVAQYVNSGPAAATLTAGTGFTLTPGTPMAASSQNTVGAEYSVLSSSTTACP